MIDEDGQSSYWYNKELWSKGVVVGVIRGLELEVDQVAGGRAGTDVEHLHHCVVERDKCREQIQVPRQEHHQKQHLAFPR